MKYQLWIQYDPSTEWLMYGFYISAVVAQRSFDEKRAERAPQDIYDYEIVEVRTKHA